MRAGHMSMRLELGFILALGLGAAAQAQTTADCDTLSAAVQTAVGVGLPALLAGRDGDWCALDGARLVGDGPVRVSAESLRIRGEVTDGELLALEVDAGGLRVTPSLTNRDMPGWLRDLLRLQRTDLHLALRRDEAADLLALDNLHLSLSGGSELVLAAQVAGGRLSAASVLTGRVTALHLEWSNDGRVLRPVIEALGTAIAPDASGTTSVDTARSALLGLVGVLPSEVVPEASAKALSEFVRALPQGRGRLVVDFTSDSGIGAAQLGLLAMSDAPMGAQALGRVFAGSEVSASWTPGLTP